MNIQNQYGAGLRTGMLIGAGSFALLMLALVAMAPAAQWNVTPSVGSINVDRLGGIGSSKSVAHLEMAMTHRHFSASARFWRIAEKLDDDAGISPVIGGTIDAGWRIVGPWRAGGLVSTADDHRFIYATAGLQSKNAGIDLLIPVNDSRFGLRASLRAPLSGGWFAQAHYEYTGRQDPDIKIVNVGLGLGRRF